MYEQQFQHVKHIENVHPLPQSLLQYLPQDDSEDDLIDDQVAHSKDHMGFMP